MLIERQTMPYRRHLDVPIGRWPTLTVSDVEQLGREVEQAIRDGGALQVGLPSYTFWPLDSGRAIRLEASALALLPLPYPPEPAPAPTPAPAEVPPARLCGAALLGFRLGRRWGRLGVWQAPIAGIAASLAGGGVVGALTWLVGR